MFKMKQSFLMIFLKVGGVYKKIAYKYFPMPMQEILYSVFDIIVITYLFVIVILDDCAYY
jgi:hypothetical protein